MVQTIEVSQTLLGVTNEYPGDLATLHMGDRHAAASVVNDTPIVMLMTEDYHQAVLRALIREDGAVVVDMFCLDVQLEVRGGRLVATFYPGLTPPDSA